MDIADFDFELPEHLIADAPLPQRDASRLLVLPDDPAAAVAHRRFRDLPELLREGDLLVMNDSRVLPARLLGRRLPGGGGCEALLLAPMAPDGAGRATWSALCRPAKKLKPGTRLDFGALAAEVLEDLGEGEKRLALEGDGDIDALLDAAGTMPLPPYILARRGERASRDEDRERYQTVYAREKGSVAAPTAGLHFTPDLLDRLAARGVRRAWVTLHVGAGTFLPVKAERLEDHRMHSEWYRVPEEAAAEIEAARAEGRRVVAVGTTTVRTLETAADAQGRVRTGAGESRLLIAPGHRWRVVDALVTNFHLPKSTLLALVAAAAGRERILAAYREAIAEGYRFYSYGDAMLLGTGRRGVLSSGAADAD